jgi:hypothetical protein
MKCTHCSKVIPDGFTDCPWCGASSTTPSTGASVRFASPQSEASSTPGLILGISAVTSGLLFLGLSYFATSRTTGPLGLENWDAFLGRCLGAVVLAGLLVFAYCKVRNAKLRGPVQALVVLTLSSLLTVLTLALPARPRMGAIDPRTVRRYSETAAPRKAPNAPPVVQTKWDPAARSLMKDVQSRNEQYVAEISGLDQTAKPLYTIESFHDAASIQEMIDQLHTRVAVADKYMDWQPIFLKMKDYVAAVNASDEEKRNFMASYQATLPQTLAACKAISDKEHGWLQASLDLYQFALSKEGTFDWQRDHLSFRNRADSDAFQRKFVKARTLNQEFLKAYWQVREAQEAMMAQLGLPGSEADSHAIEK